MRDDAVENEPLLQQFSPPMTLIQKRQEKGCIVELRAVVSDVSALECWRHRRAIRPETCAVDGLRDATARANTFLRNQVKPRFAQDGASVADSELLVGCSAPVTVLANGDCARVKTGQLSSRRCAALPNRSVLTAGGEFAVVGPELCFVQMAASLSLVDAVLLAFEFCGTYVKLPDGATAYGVRPLTDAGKLRSFAKRAVGTRGRTNALRALRFVADGSASPMETLLVVGLCLPYRLGGFGLPLPKLNREMRVAGPSGVARVRYADVCWEEERLVCEYDSDEFHPDERRPYDLRRRNELREAGYTVLEVDKAHVMSAVGFRDFAKRLASLHGKRCCLPQNFDASYVALRAQLFGSKRNSLLV